MDVPSMVGMNIERKIDENSKKSNPENYKKNRIKEARLKGQSYINYKGNTINAKEVGDACGCPKNCLHMIGAENSNETFLDFYNCFSTKDEQDLFISGLIDVEDIAKRRPGSKDIAAAGKARFSGVSTTPQQQEAADEGPTPAKKARGWTDGKTFRYHVLVGSERVPVCAKAFLSIYALSEKRVRRVRQLKVEGKEIKDLRLMHTGNVLSEDVQIKIRSHICSFPRVVTTTDCGEIVQYLSADLNVKTMYKMFRKDHPDVTVSYQTYWFFFKEHFSLRFGPPQAESYFEH